MDIFSIIKLVMAIASGLPSLITAAQSVFGAVRGQGAVKKESVQAAVGAALNVAAQLGNDDAAKPAVQAAILEGTSGLVDSLAASMKAAGAFAKAAPVLGPDK